MTANRKVPISSYLLMPFRWDTLLKRGPIYALAEGETPERESEHPQHCQKVIRKQARMSLDTELYFMGEKHISKLLDNILKSLMATGRGAMEWVQK